MITNENPNKISRSIFEFCRLELSELPPYRRSAWMQKSIIIFNTDINCYFDIIYNFNHNFWLFWDKSNNLDNSARSRLKTNITSEQQRGHIFCMLSILFFILNSTQDSVNKLLILTISINPQHSNKPVNNIKLCIERIDTIKLEISSLEDMIRLI